MWYNIPEMDKKYLFKRNNVWWVKLAVPVYLREKLGFDLRKSTGEKDLEKALLARWTKNIYLKETTYGG